jgi:hypothetical protein
MVRTLFTQFRVSQGLRQEYSRESTTDELLDHFAAYSPPETTSKWTVLPPER